eukprot:315958-Chlamydomonas_euryale.AAC.3
MHACFRARSLARVLASWRPFRAVPHDACNPCPHLEKPKPPGAAGGCLYNACPHLIALTFPMTFLTPPRGLRSGAHGVARGLPVAIAGGQRSPARSASPRSRHRRSTPLLIPLERCSAATGNSTVSRGATLLPMRPGRAGCGESGREGVKVAVRNRPG